MLRLGPLVPAGCVLTAVEQQGAECHSECTPGNALVDQWFQLHASTAEAQRSPGWRTEIPQASGCDDQPINEQTDKHIPQGIPGGRIRCEVKMSALSLPKVWVPSLVRELGSHKPWGTAENKNAPRSVTKWR